MRNRYIVSYDICDDKRLRRVHKTMRGFGDALQYSVFLCDLSASERIILLEKLTPIINHREDQIMLVNLGPADGQSGQRIETVGRGLEQSLARSLERVAIIV